MTPENNSPDKFPQRFAFTPLKPKRRSKLDDNAQLHEPVLINAAIELRRHRDRITRSGRPNLTFRRVTSPIEISELVPKKSRPPVLARVVDKVKSRPLRSRNGHSIWSLLRCWALAFR